MTSPQRAQDQDQNRRDSDDTAARSGRFKVRIDAFGRLVPEVVPVDGDSDDERPAAR